MIKNSSGKNTGCYEPSAELSGKITQLIKSEGIQNLSRRLRLSRHALLSLAAATPCRVGTIAQALRALRSDEGDADNLPIDMRPSNQDPRDTCGTLLA